MADPGVQWLVGTPPFLSIALQIAWKWANNELDCYPFKQFWIRRPWICPLNGKCSMILRKSLNFKIVATVTEINLGQSEHSYNSSLDLTITGRQNDVQIHHRHHHVFSSKPLWNFIFIFVGLSDQRPSDYRTVGIRNRRTFGALDYMRASYGSLSKYTYFSVFTQLKDKYQPN